MATKRTTLAKGIFFFKVFILATAAAAFVYIFYTLSATRMLNSFEELCITLAGADNSFARVLNPHGGAYIYIHIWLNIIDTFCLHIYLLILSNCRIDLMVFELPNWSYDIRRESVDKSSIISYLPSTFYPTLGHHLGRMYYKSDVTFVCTLLLCKKSVSTVVLCSVYFPNLFLLIVSVAKDI